MLWQFLRTGTSNPLGVATATEISMKFLLITSFPSMTELTIGYSCKARVAAFMKKDMKPSLIPYFLRKSSPSYWINAVLPFLCLLLRTCRLLGRLSEEHKYSGNLSIFDPLFVSTLTLAHESTSSLQRKLEVVVEEELTWVYLLWEPLWGHLSWVPIEIVLVLD